MNDQHTNFIAYAGIPNTQSVRQTIQSDENPYHIFNKNCWILFTALSNLQQKIKHGKYCLTPDEMISTTEAAINLRRDIRIINAYHQALMESASTLIDSQSIEKLSLQAKDQDALYPAAYQQELNRIQNTHHPVINRVISNNRVSLKKYKAFAKDTAFLCVASSAACIVFFGPAAYSFTAAIVMASLSGGLLIGIPILLGLSYLAVKTYYKIKDTQAKKQLTTAKQDQIDRWISNQNDKSKINFFRVQQLYQHKDFQPLQQLVTAQ